MANDSSQHRHGCVVRAYVSHSKLWFSVKKNSRSRIARWQKMKITWYGFGFVEYVCVNPFRFVSIKKNSAEHELRKMKYDRFSLGAATQHVCRYLEKWFQHYTFNGNEPPGWLMIIILMTNWITIIISYSNMKMILCQVTLSCAATSEIRLVNAVCLLCRIINFILSEPDHSNVSFSYEFVYSCF